MVRGFSQLNLLWTLHESISFCSINAPDLISQLRPVYLVSEVGPPLLNFFDSMEHFNPLSGIVAVSRQRYVKTMLMDANYRLN